MWLALLVACQPKTEDDSASAPRRLDLPADAALGERLFRETRFAWFYWRNAKDLNVPLAAGDPALDIPLADGIPNPYAGQSYACRSCHLLDEAGPVRTYADFSARTRVTEREDGATFTPRNTPALLESAGARDVPFAMHWDAEFVSAADLGHNAYTGRNMGWLPEEGGTAEAHLAAVLRADDGSSSLAAAYEGLSYADHFAGRGPGDLAITTPLDVQAASDAELLAAVAGYGAAYLEALTFLRDEGGQFSGSPYDRFLAANGYPTGPDAGESPLDYARRLRGLMVDPQPTADFGTDAIAGLRIFLAEPATLPPSGIEVAIGGLGNCLSCHPPPAFTDYGLHNTAVAEATYDRVHDVDAFLYFDIPTLAERSADPDAWLPASGSRPDASGRMRSFPVEEDPDRADLGAWNILFNPDHPEASAAITEHLVRAYSLVDPTDDQLLAHAVGTFKTPTLRGLSMSPPYFHDGSMADLEAVLRFYRGWTAVARDGFTVNSDPQFLGVAIEEGDVAPLLAFLEGLEEPYPD